MRNRIGVYICKCGENIAAYCNCKDIKEAVSNEEGVVLTKVTMFACADSSQKEMIKDIKENNLDGLVVASCSPKLHMFTFRHVAERAGLNPYNYTQANIREQVSWPHSNTPQEATDKAINVVKAAIAKTRNSEPLIPPSVSSDNVCLVVGAGIAGMRSAIELADMGTHVYLIEKDHYVGGRVSQWGSVFRTNQNGGELVEKLYNEIKKRKDITLFTSAELIEKSGTVGSFDVKVKIKPRFIKPQSSISDKTKFQENIKKAIDVCPEEIEDEFNFGLTKRKAIYNDHKGQFPNFPAIDGNICTFCKKCLDVCPEIDLCQKEEVLNLRVGAIVLGVGFDPYSPKHGEFGYKEIENVVTLPEFKRLVELSNGSLQYENKTIKNISYIYCVGSRQINGENKYCSRYCCTAAVHTSLELKKKYSYVNNFHFHRGMRTYGKQEPIYEEASKNGDLFFQSRDDELPSIEQKDGRIIVKVKDMLTLNREIEIDSDLVVLVTSMVPRKNESLIELLKVPSGKDKFFKEVHPKLKPVETVIDGVFLAGSCHAPKNISETVNSALAASVKAASLISKGEIILEPTLARIDENLCIGSGECIKACPFNAIFKVEHNGKIVSNINEAVCKGCGICLPVCPNNAIQLSGYTDAQIENMIDALAY